MCCNPLHIDNEIDDVELEMLWELQRYRDRLEDDTSPTRGRSSKSQGRELRSRGRSRGRSRSKSKTKHGNNDYEDEQYRKEGKTWRRSTSRAKSRSRSLSRVRKLLGLGRSKKPDYDDPQMRYRSYSQPRANRTYSNNRDDVPTRRAGSSLARSQSRGTQRTVENNRRQSYAAPEKVKKPFWSRKKKNKQVR